MRNFIKRRLLDPITTLLVQGITPEKIALSLALGAVLAVFPVLGSTTLLCAAAAVLLRLNLPAIQLVNWLMYPMQLALVVPFMRAGAHLFRTSPLPFSVVQMLTMFQHDWLNTLKLLWVSALQAITVWMLCAPIVAALLYCTLRPVLSRVARTVRPAETHA
jgi:uncharacterized protein (DUF2062 family)